MDEALTKIADRGASSSEGVLRGMPPEAPGLMPPQALARFDGAASRRAPRRPGGARSARWRRLLVLGTAAALAGFAIDEMRLALAVGQPSAIAIAVLVLFAINVTWISLPFVASVVGFVRAVGRRRGAPEEGAPLSSRTALLMPTHNEDPARVAAALDAMASDLVLLGEGRSFDVFLLSDSTHGDVALREQEVVWTLRCRLGGAIGVYYRRRAENTARKPGNIRDFCERWGSAYDHLLVLDADSLMDGGTIVRLARRMEADPDAGVIQTIPRLHRGTTLLARLQQFAGRVYGTLLGEGFAWWAGSEATFWGHNAILRTEAFMASAGLPVLPGEPPLGGPILSHDFVEAALIRRRGWKVSIAHDLEGSYEECPPSLVDQAIRDRRWCQGNLQHVRVLRARGLHWVSRLHLVAGIMSYLASPFWLLFVLSALALGVQYEFARQQYFAHTPSLFPLWPRIDPARAIRLFGLTMGILLGPKVLGLLSIVLRPRRLRESGGLVRLVLGFALEALLSALIAPVQALIHCGLVADVVRGRDSGWRVQRREGERVTWGAVLRGHRWHALAGVALALVAAAISGQMLAWLAPAVVGMALAAPLSKLVASPGVGRLVQRLGLLRTPEEVRVPAIVRAAEAALPVYRDAIARTPDLADVVGDAALLERHLALTDRTLPRPRGRFDATEALAEKKIRDAYSAEEAIATLSAEERARVQASPQLLGLLRPKVEAARRGSGPSPGAAH
jgi:membrane glycosyltransferase